jgi:glycosyltransferase involved in cell wall biosynthesis
MSCRKGWELLVRAYLEEFSAREDVCLYLKTGYGSSTAEGQEDQRLITYILEILGRDPDRIPDVVLVNETLSNRQMPSLYCAADAFVLPSRGEAFGRSLMEAMACGLPVIGTGWSGNTEFMTDSNSYLIDYELVEVDEDAVDEDDRLEGHRWAEPSVDHLKLLLRKVYERRVEARDVGATGRERIEARFSTDLIARQIEERIALLSSVEKTRRD